jgi:HlyD family secretion protein
MPQEEKIELRSEEFQEVLGSVPHWILRWGITVLTIVVVILLSGSALIKYPDVLPSQVTLTGSMPPAVIVARASGKLKELYVADNQEVKAGEYLGVIENAAKTEDIRRLKECLSDSNFQVSGFGFNELITDDTGGLRVEPAMTLGGLQSAFSAFRAALHEYSEYRRLMYYPQKIEMTKERKIQYEKQYITLLNQQKLTEEQLGLVRNKFQRDSLLSVKGVISKEDLENSRNAFLQSLMSYENIKSSLNNMKIQIGQLDESLLDTKQRDIETLNNLQTRLQTQISQLQAEILNWELTYTLVTPIDGKVTLTNYWVENQNVMAGNPVFTVVPNDSLPVIGKAILPIARSGKVKTGQKVNIRLQNFPENEYGILRGTVQNISLAPTQTGETSYYILEILLTDGLITTYKKELPSLPDMQGQADIVTEDLSLLERLALPLKKILRESL